jgi:hypothetical protein
MAQLRASSSAKMCSCGTDIFGFSIRGAINGRCDSAIPLEMQIIRGKSDGRWFRRLKNSSLVPVDSSIWGFANNFLVHG